MMDYLHKVTHMIAKDKKYDIQHIPFSNKLKKMSWQKSIFHSITLDTIHTFSNDCSLTDCFPLYFPSGRAVRKF